MNENLAITEMFAKGVPAIEPSLKSNIRASEGYNQLFDGSSAIISGTPPKDYERFMHLKFKRGDFIINTTASGKLTLDPELKKLTRIHTSVPFNISGKHVHLTAAHYKELYGEEMPTEGKNLIQPGQFQFQIPFKDRPNLLLPEPKTSIKHFSIIGGPRPVSQAEVDLNYMIAQQLNIPHRESGDLKGAPFYELQGPTGVTIPIQVISAIDHIHVPENMLPEINDLEKVLVAYKSKYNGCKYIFPNVIARKSPTAGLEVHVNKSTMISEALQEDYNPTAEIFKYHF